MRLSDGVRHPEDLVHSFATDAGMQTAVCFVRNLSLVSNQDLAIFPI